MISTFEQVWDKIDGENKPLMEILETLQKEISEREGLVHELYEARDFKELTKVEQERMAFIQVQYGIQDLTYLDNGNESDVWKAALAKRPEAQERENETRARWKANTEAWSKVIEEHRTEIEDAIWKVSSQAREGVPGRYETVVHLGGQSLTVYKVTPTEEEQDVENERFEMSSTEAKKYIDVWKERFLETSVAKETAPEKEENRDKNLIDEMVQEVRQAETDGEMREKELEMTKIQGPNMAEVQAAESKASLIQGLDRSADGLSHIEGHDVGYAEESYVIAADQVKYEAQRARTADGEQRTQGAGEEAINPKIGQRVAFQPHDSKKKLFGRVVDMDDETVTLQSGRTLIPALRDKGTFTEAPERESSHTKEYAKERAQKHVGEHGSVFLAKGRDAAYKGTIVELTPTFAIQKVNSETAILHRLKDLEARDKDGNELIREGQGVSITKEGSEKGGVVIEPWDQKREERQKVREHERSRGSQSR
jgi:hypothetical protein